MGNEKVAFDLWAFRQALTFAKCAKGEILRSRKTQTSSPAWLTGKVTRFPPRLTPVTPGRQSLCLPLSLPHTGHIKKNCAIALQGLSDSNTNRHLLYASIQPTLRLTRQPPAPDTQPRHTTTGAVGPGVAAGEGATLSLLETDGCCRQKCRSPSPRETHHAGGALALRLLEIGAYDCKIIPPKTPRPVPKHIRRDRHPQT